MSGCNHAKGFRRKQRRLKYDKRRDGPTTRAACGLRHGPGCKHPKIFPVMTVTAHYGVAQDRGSPKENKPPVHNDNGDLSNFLFYSADTLASVHISTGMHAGGRLLPPVSYISCNGLFFFLPSDRCVSPPSPHQPCCKRSGSPGDTPSFLLCFQSEWAPFRLFSRPVYPGDEAAVDSGIKSCQLRWHVANNALPSANPCGPQISVTQRSPVATASQIIQFDDEKRDRIFCKTLLLVYLHLRKSVLLLLLSLHGKSTIHPIQLNIKNKVTFKSLQFQVFYTIRQFKTVKDEQIL